MDTNPISIITALGPTLFAILIAAAGSVIVYFIAPSDSVRSKFWGGAGLLILGLLAVAALKIAFKDAQDQNLVDSLSSYIELFTIVFAANAIWESCSLKRTK